MKAVLLELKLLQQFHQLLVWRRQRLIPNDGLAIASASSDDGAAYNKRVCSAMTAAKYRQAYETCLR